MAYGLQMASSDLDCFVYLPDHNSTSIENLRNVLEEAKNLLQRHPDFINFYTWTNLTVPVLSFDHEPTKFDVDLSFNTYNERQRSQLIRFLTILDKKAYYLAFIVKYWSRGSNTAGEYLLRNHGMFLLVIFYLQQKNVLPSIASLQDNAAPFMIEEWNFGFDVKSYETQNDESLSSIIGGFFKYYSEFDFDNYIISAYAGYPIQKSVFEHLETVPAEFILYKKNVMSEESPPLHISPGMMVQDLFIHNQCINNTLDTHPDSPFMVIFEDAARRFQEEEEEVRFIKNLRGEKSYVLNLIERFKLQLDT